MSMEIWNKVKRPPKEALKQIKGGRLSGMTDISPQWRYQAMTEVFGVCGVGWKYEIQKLWTEPGYDGQVMAFAMVGLYIKTDGAWSDAIPGIGGSALIAKEKNGLYSSDEAYKMAVTDALSVAMKQIGVAADIYMGMWDGSKYREAPKEQESKAPVKAALKGVQINEEDQAFLRELAAEIVHMVESEDNQSGAFDRLEGAMLDDEQKLYLWDVLQPNSKTRSAIKKEGEWRRNQPKEQ